MVSDNEDDAFLFVFRISLLGIVGPIGNKWHSMPKICRPKRHLNMAFAVVAPFVIKGWEQGRKIKPLRAMGLMGDKGTEPSCDGGERQKDS